MRVPERVSYGLDALDFLVLAPFLDGRVALLPDGLAVLLEAKLRNAKLLVEAGQDLNGLAPEGNNECWNELKTNKIHFCQPTSKRI